MKTCSKCHDAKPLACFGLQSTAACGRRAACRLCEAERMRGYRASGAGVNAKGTGGLSHREIARRLGMSKSRIQQLEASAMRKLRAALAEGWR